jgi:oligosaccharide repeat unit polymerase
VPGIIRLWALTLVPGTVLLSVGRVTWQRQLVTSAVAVGLLLMLGYRTPILLLLGTLAILLRWKNRLPTRYLVAALVLTVAGSVFVYSFRLSETGASPYGRTVKAAGPLVAAPWLTPLYYSFFHEGVTVFGQMSIKVPSQHPYLGGALEAATIASLLPGKQPSPRQTITALAYNTTAPPTTLTPTLIGGPYVDFGAAGVVVFSAALAALLTALYRLADRARAADVARVAYAYAAVLTALSIHTGLLDGALLIGLPALTGAAVLAFSLLAPRAVSVST